MIKKIKTEVLRPGMFVHDFDCAWLEIPFFQTRILIRDEAMVEKVFKHGIREVYIDTEKGLDVADGVPLEEVQKETDISIKKTAGMARPAAGADAPPLHSIEVADSVPLRKELDNAKVVRDEANRVIVDVMHDLRFGKQIEMEKVDHVVGDIVESVINNKHALMSLSRIKQKDEYTFMHSVSVGVLTVSFCKTLGLNRQIMNQIGLGAILHDVGKMKVQQDILNKRGTLTDEEFELMKDHVVQGRKILEETADLPAPAMAVAVEHHERLDGSGYPDGLKGEEISLYGQMAAIVDVYDAITSNRVYHNKIEPADALKKIYEWRGRHFSEDIVQNYIKCVGIYPIGTLVRMESGFLGVITEQGSTDMLRPRVRLIFNTKKEIFINPKDMDLSSPDSGNDRIVSSESPQKWKVNPMMYMDIFG
ncbi:MAG: HD-GYP domain-containing protein [Nitrospinota bacterium]